ncbi:DUF2336 domain-containing protein [Aestuariispira insulae]|uniref:Uncharacterized protein (DUF2336 family) n=1 Tax=Aestuariispira insulae TaxID=1461337 RepID=A0A3D9HNB3_9PROT|nr:DUF2336 domain-containing protein [Aestuariispira insulae]RED50905.1 uncharacterized protein (DUF2336 family) [Aestuariispira insulae]
MSDMRPVSYERLLRLAHQRAIDGKGGLAASIAKMCLDSRAELTAQELELTYAILRQLIDKVEIEIRRYIADYLAERTDVPDDLIDFLSNDTINVAYPILVHSRQLDDVRLVKIIHNQARSHHMAIAERDGLSELVSAALVDTDDNEVAAQLTKNYSAKISRQSLDQLVERSIDDENLQAGIARRRDLPDDLARRMYIWVGESLRNHISQQFDIDPELVNAAVSHAVKKGHEGPDFEQLRESLNDDEPELQEGTGRSIGDSLVQALINEGKEGFMYAFSGATGLNMTATRSIFDMTNLETIAIACKAIGFGRTHFGRLLQELLGAKFRQYNAKGLFDKALAYFDKVDKDNAGGILQSWKTLPQEKWKKS